MFLKHAQGNRFLSPRLVLVALLLSLGIGKVSAADLVFSPATATVEKGKIITVGVYVTNNTQSINAVSGTVSYPSDTLSLTSISKSGSIIGLWPEEPSYSNANGTAKFEGVILNPGFSGSRGKVISFTFTAKQAGTANLSFSAGDVLANDGNASSVIGNLGTGTYTITVQDTTTPVPTPSPSDQGTVLTPAITSSTYPDENAWYNSRNATFSWNLPSGVTAVRTLYDQDVNGRPNKIYDPAIATKSFTSDTDGVFYMHVQFKDAAGWGGVATRKFQIDTATPSRLTATLLGGETITSETPKVTITAQDAGSGIDHYGVSVDGASEVSYAPDSDDTYTLPKMVNGKHDVQVTAYDKAGNKTSTTLAVTITKLDVPAIVEYTMHAVVGDTLKISGITYPGKTVEVRLVDDSKHVESQSVLAKDDGSFSLTWSKDISAGVYEMSARVTDGASTSDWSDPRLMVVENVKLIRIGMFIMNWLSLILIIILAATLVAATLWYSLLQFSRFRRGIHRTIRDAENTLKTNVQALRRDTEEFHTLLIKTQKKRELTKEEATIMKKFKKRLDITEKEIEKKLEQIG